MAESRHSTRRAFLKSAAAASALPIAGGAEIAMAEELPVDKVNRLARELSLALNDYADGAMHAEIHPSGKRRLPIGFVVTDIHIPPMVALRSQIENTKTAMAKAYPDRDIRAFQTIDDDNATVVIVTEV